MGTLAAIWTYGIMPLWFLVALAWILAGCLDVVKGIFAQLMAEAGTPTNRFRPPGAASVVAGAILVIGPAYAFQRVASRNTCEADCSVFSDHRRETAWLSLQYSAIALVVVAALWALSVRRGWRWMG